MTKATHQLHGWRVKDQGKGTVDRYDYFLVNPVDHDYGYSLGLISTEHKSLKSARELAYSARSGDDAFGHSNGCFIIAEALWAGAALRRVIFINPALDRDFVLPPWHVCPTLEAVLVFYCPNDRAVRLGRLVPWNSWGDAGARGLSQADKDPRIINVDYTPIADLHDLKTGHSKVFKNPEVYGPWLQAWQRCDEPQKFDWTPRKKVTP